MTKRPLLCGVLVFVFGEAIGIRSYITMGVGLVVGVWYIWKLIAAKKAKESETVQKTKKAKAAAPFFRVFMGLCFVLGILNGMRVHVPDAFQSYVEEYTRSDYLQCELVGTVLRMQRQEERTVLLVRTDAIYNADFTIKDAYRIRLYLSEGDMEAGEADRLNIGSQIHCELQLTVPATPTNPGEFNSETYYHARGITFLGYVDVCECLDVRQAVIRQGVMELQTKAQQVFEQALKAEYAGVMDAMLLGLSGDLDSDIKALYQRNGISHILAISALHISILGSAIYKLLRKLGLPYALSGIPVIFVLLLYGWMTGFSGSTIRAVMMFSVFLFGDIIGRTYDMLTAAGAACLYMLIEQPVRIMDAGFLLSFSAVLTLGFVLPKVQELFTKESKWRTMLLSGILIQMITAPIVIHFYYDFPLYAFLLNLIVIPFMTPLLVCGLTGLLLYPLFPIAGIWVIQPCGFILSLFQWMCERIEQLPFAILSVGAMPVWRIFIYYMFLVGIYLLLKHKKRYPAALGVAMYLCLSVLLIPQTLQAVMLDIGQGDSILLRTPDGSMILVDGGSSTRTSAGTYIITPAVKYYGANAIDYVFVSHMDSDHVNAIEELISLSAQGGISIHYLILPKIAQRDEAFAELIEQAQTAGIQVQMIGQGEGLQIGEVAMECLYPSDEAYFSDDENNNSMVLSLHYEEFDMLFTGDLEIEGEALLMEQSDLGSYDVLKVGHHGSSGASSQIFLDRVEPRVALISCGRGNRYGHPHEETLERLQQQETSVYCTKDDGAILITTNGRNMRVRSYLTEEPD